MESCKISNTHCVLVAFLLVWTASFSIYLLDKPGSTESNVYLNSQR
jgi:hypothetical protein